MIQINLVCTFRCIARSAAGTATLDALPKRRTWVIVNTASVAAQDSPDGPGRLLGEQGRASSA
ncbi:MAG: hypothetical protein IPP44_12690 [Ideonella sp.]|nr:hypothetical protein [Ideonella sp.]